MNIPQISAVAGHGPFADDQDPTLDSDISDFKALPTLAQINRAHTIAAKDEAWQAHVSRLKQYHELHVRIIASEERAKHRVIVHEIHATHEETLEEMSRNFELELNDDGDLHDDLHVKLMMQEDEKHEAQIDEIDRGWSKVLDKVNEALNSTREELKGLKVEMVELKEENDGLRGDLRMMMGPYARVEQGPSEASPVGSEADNFAAQERSDMEVTIHHPNNVKRAKDLRILQPRATDGQSWTMKENLSHPAGGLAYRKHRMDLGLPTPQDMNETVKIIKDVDWTREDGGNTGKEKERVEEWLADTATNDQSPTGSSERYRRGNGSVTRSGKKIKPGHGQAYAPFSMSTSTSASMSAPMSTMFGPTAHGGDGAGGQARDGARGQAHAGADLAATHWYPNAPIPRQPSWLRNNQYVSRTHHVFGYVQIMPNGGPRTA